jgi:hypothetical protein
MNLRLQYLCKKKFDFLNLIFYAFMYVSLSMGIDSKNVMNGIVMNGIVDECKPNKRSQKVCR